MVNCCCKAVKGTREVNYVYADFIKTFDVCRTCGGVIRSTEMKPNRQYLKFAYNLSEDLKPVDKSSASANVWLREKIYELRNEISELVEENYNLKTENENLCVDLNEARDAIDELQTENAEIVQRYKAQSNKLNKVTDELIEEKKHNINLQGAINKLSEIIWGNIK